VARKQVGLPGELVDQIDIVAEAVNLSRNAYVEQAVRAWMEQPRSTQRMRISQAERTPEVTLANRPPERPRGKRNVRPAYPKASKR
jgi:metal-responsive CopG/Arc/MetJ family transcriptional regulator